MESGKGFIVMAVNIAFTYRAVFSAWKAGRVWHGGEPPAILGFSRPDGTRKKCGVCWMTNQPHGNMARTITPRDCSLEYPVYDEFPTAIHVPRLAAIPRGYTGLAGVPSTLAFYDRVDGVAVEPLGVIYPHIRGAKKFARFLCRVGKG